MTSPTPSPISDQAAGELRVLPKDVLDALRFYAHGNHYSIDDDHQSFDTVSGEPVNWMFSEKEDDCTMFEDGGIARAVLTGRSMGFEEPVEPFEGEVFAALSTAPTTGIPPETDDTFIMGYKVGAKLCGTVADAQKAIIQGHGSSWEPLYRKNHPKTTGSAPAPSYQNGYAAGVADARECAALMHADDRAASPAASVLTDEQAEQRARELLAEAYAEPAGEGPYPTYVELAKSGHGSFTKCSIRAIKRALLAASMGGGEK